MHHCSLSVQAYSGRLLLGYALTGLSFPKVILQFILLESKEQQAWGVMRLTFQLRFHTQYGESLYLTGNHELFGADKVENAIPLEFLNDEFWRVTVVIPKAAVHDAFISYRYI